MKKANLKVTSTGLMLVLSEGGQLDAKPITVPDAWVGTRGAEWLSEFPASVRITGEGTETVVTLGKEGDELAVDLFKGNEDDARLVSRQMHQTWLKANGLEAPEEVKFEPAQAAPADPVRSSASAGAASATPTATKRSWKRTTFIGVGCAAVFAAIGTVSFIGINKFVVKPHAEMPSLDMSAMPLEQIAEMDKNPAVMRGIQDQMLEAVQVGRDKAKSLEGTIPEQHIKLLESMGLDPGASMKSAAACLSSM